MFTAINFASSQSIIDGEVLIGRSSGARGYVHSAAATMQCCTRYLVSSKLVKLSKEMVVFWTLAPLYSLMSSLDIRQMVGYDTPTGSTIIFTASLALNESIALTGKTITVDKANDVTGFDTAFAADLRPGDVISPVATDNKGSTSLRVRRVDGTNIAFTALNRKSTGTTPVFDLVCR